MSFKDIMNAHRELNYTENIEKLQAEKAKLFALLNKILNDDDVMMSEDLLNEVCQCLKELEGKNETKQ